LTQGLGRLAQAEEPGISRVPESVEALKNMSWDEMQVLFALTYADEITAVGKLGFAAVRDKLESLSEDERSVLRHALAAE
jgi:hypothetical protein